MTNHEPSGYWRRLWSALKRAVLGKSSHDYMRRFSSGDEYWDRATAAQRGLATVSSASDSETEPVHGWTNRQLNDYLAHNPDYASIYNAKLHNRGMNGAPASIINPTVAATQTTSAFRKEDLP